MLVGVLQQSLTTREEELLVFPFFLPLSCIHPLLGISKEKVQQHLCVNTSSDVSSDKWAVRDISLQRNPISPNLPHSPVAALHIVKAQAVSSPLLIGNKDISALSHFSWKSSPWTERLLICVSTASTRKKTIAILHLYLTSSDTEKQMLLYIFYLVSYPKVHTLEISS